MDLTDTNKTVIFDRFELDEGNKYYIGYENGESGRPCCIILFQMTEFITYVDGNRKNHVIFKWRWRNNDQIYQNLVKHD